MNQINQYTQKGNIYLWEYAENKNFPGFQMAWDELGRNSFQAFLSLLQMSEVGTFRTLKVSKPTVDVLSVPNNLNSKISSFVKMRIEMSDCTEWKFFKDGDTCNIKLSAESAREWSSIVSAVAPQEELSFKGIYFWW